MAQKISKKQLAAPFVGVFVMLAVLGLMNAQVVTAYAYLWTQPATSVDVPERAVTTKKKQGHPANTKEPLVIMPAAGIEAPAVYGMDSVQEADVQRALERGVLHFGGSALPGERGNAVFVGHSSGQPWAPGEYKFVFTMLQRLEPGDKVQLAYKGELYTYKVTEKNVVDPRDVSVLDESREATATFITCWPVGVNAQRLVVTAKLISHDPRERSNVHGAPELEDVLPGDGYTAIEAVRERLR